MKKYTAILSATLLLAAACTKESVEISPLSETTIKAISEFHGSRTVVQENGTSVFWSAGDKLDIFCGPGTEPAVFTGQNEAPAATATFSGPALDALDSGMPPQAKYYFGVYPSSKANAVGADGSITIELKSEQNAVAGTFESDLFPAVAREEGRTFNFFNVAGGVKFSVDEDNVTEVVFESRNAQALAGVAKVAFSEGVPVLTSVETPSTTVSVSAPAGGFVKGESYYAVMLPVTLSEGITITLKRGSDTPLVISSDNTQTVKRGCFGRLGELKATASAATSVERVWGLYSSSAASWNEYYGGKPDTDRNVAMDDEYIYIAETRGDAAKLWAISIADPTQVKAVNTEGVDGGFWKLACPRVINDSNGNPTLMCSNMNTTGDEAVDPKLYIWNDGIDSAPTAITLFCSTPTQRIGDTFSFWGTFDKGMLLFASNSGEIRMWKMKDKRIDNGNWVVSRYVTNTSESKKVWGIGAFWPFPNDKNQGVYSVRDDVQAYSASIEDGKDAWTAPGGTLLNVKPLGSGYFLNAACFQYIDFKGKKYLAYTRNVDGSDGRLAITEGEESETWNQVIARRHSGELLYMAAIQNASELPAIDESGNGKYSGNSGMDIAWRVIGDDLYLACVKQNVGLSLFKISR